MVHKQGIGNDKDKYQEVKLSSIGIQKSQNLKHINKNIFTYTNIHCRTVVLDTNIYLLLPWML